MKLDKIISFANRKSEVRFLAMERSLRATGCNLPIWVIPYDDNLFDLPDNCIWWEIKEITSWLKANNCFNMMRKYQCLTISNYQYVDSDIVFLRNPEEVLKDVDGFIASCGHWHNPGETYTRDSVKFHKADSTTWEKSMFNCGQFACDRKLYEVDEIKKFAEDPKYKSACMDLKLSDQPGLNLFVLFSKVPVINLTLPPYNMQSTWAGDYEDENYRKYWPNEASTPYIIHWAGTRMDTGRPIDQLFLQYLKPEERKQWDEQLAQNTAERASLYYRLRRNMSHIKNALRSINYE